MGADGHITIVNKKKAIELIGKEDFEWFCDNAPTCVYTRDFNGIEVVTFYHGDNMIDCWLCIDDWTDWSDRDQTNEMRERAERLMPLIKSAQIDRWEVWT